MQRLTHLKDTVQTWHGLRDQGAYLLELVEMSLEEGDDSLEPQITKESESFLDDPAGKGDGTHPLRPLRPTARHPVHPIRRRRRRLPGLESDAPPHVPSMGGTPWL